MKDVIDRTNRFYIEMSRKVLSEKEYEVLQKLLLEKMSLQELAGNYGVTSEYVRQIYERTYLKVKSVSGLLEEIDHYKHKLKQLKQDFKCESGQVKKTERKMQAETETARHKLLLNSHFPFSKRMYSMFEVLEIHSIGQLAEIPLEQFDCFRGFKKMSRRELIAFIEFENIEHLFAGFSAWKAGSIE